MSVIDKLRHSSPIIFNTGLGGRVFRQTGRGFPCCGKSKVHDEFDTMDIREEEEMKSSEPVTPVSNRFEVDEDHDISRFSNLRVDQDKIFRLTGERPPEPLSPKFKIDLFKPNTRFDQHTANQDHLPLSAFRVPRK